MSDHLDLIMFGALMAAILSGFPVSFSIAGIAVIFAYIGWMLGEMNISLPGAILFGIATPTEGRRWVPSVRC